MIAIIVRQPNGNGTYTARYGFTTDDSSSTLDGVTLVPGFLEAVSELSHRIDISRAQGGTPEPIEWGFDLIDWETTARRSVGILEGSVQLIGWVASLYVKLPATGIWSAPILGENAFEIVAAPVSDGTISISCRERWIGKAQAVGFGTGSDRVWMVAGGMDVTVKINEINDPVPLQFEKDINWKRGSFLAPSVAEVVAAVATSKIGRTFSFQCAPGTGGDLYNALIAQTCYITGSEYSELVGNVALNTDRVDVQVSQEFCDNESIENVALYSSTQAMRPVIGGASALVGFVGDNLTVAPLGDTELSEYVISFAPRKLRPGGFSAFTHVPCSIVYEPPVRWGDTSDPAGRYSGAVENIKTDKFTTPDYDPIYDDLALTIPSSSMALRAFPREESVLYLWLKLRIILDDPSVKFDAYDIDVKDRILVKNSGYLGDSPKAGIKFPFSSAAFPEYTSPHLTATLLGDPSGSPLYTCERSLGGPGSYKRVQRFDTIEEANQTEGMMIAGDVGVLASYQACSIHVYGISTLSYGSSYAVVTPGSSPWWASTPSPAEAASALLASAGFTAYTVDTINAPSWVAPTDAWGRAFDQDVTTTDAADDICREFWLLARRNSVTNQAAADGEILQVPSFTLGDRSDIVTEPVVEYDHWAGEYRRRAYIAHVDEEYNSATPERYFGGWDTTGGGWGLALWNTCRNAWLHHGIQRAETFQSPSVRDPSTLGRMWANSSRSGATRGRWLASQARYMTFAVAEIFPDWWAGDSVYPPTVSADAAGYDLSAYASTPLVVTEKRWDPMSLTTSVEVALPPAIPGAGGAVIQQTVSQDDDIIQQTSSISDNLLQQVGN